MKVLKILFILLVFSNTAFAGDNIRKISVTGKSKVSLDAQYSIIHTELKYVKKTVDESYKELQKGLSAIIENLNKVGLTNQVITKSLIMQGEEKRWENKSWVHVGYYSSCNIQLRINNLSKLPSIYKELSRYNALAINSTDYGRNDEFERRNEGFKKALLAAKEKALLMAKSLNAEVGPVFNIHEISVENYASKKLYSNYRSEESSGSTYGSVDITATVAVEFELQ
ncbi:MAG: SIMPL domain-containing protein [Deltaproteobacteria bacterium]|nr:SIMPL domain-containing protein [Deltaproteobacteria bacterium]